MSLNNVRAVGDDRPWKDEVERELKTLLNIIKYGKISLRSISGSTSSGGGGGGAGADVISATLPATYDNTTYVIGVDQDEFDRIGNLDYAQFDTTYSGGSTDVGILAWSQEFETFEAKLDPHVTLQFGQEHLVRVKNASESTPIPIMSVVMFTGATGDTVTVSPAVTDGSVSEDYIVGVTTEEIAADGFGFVTQFGFITGVNTLAYSLGDILYANPAVAGGLTTTQPSAPNLKLPLAAVTRVHAETGRVLVRAFVGKKLFELHDVQVTSITDGEFLVWNDTSDRWENKTGPEAGLITTSDTGTVTNTMLAGSITNDKLSNSALTVNGTSISLGGSGTVTAAPSGSAGGKLSGTYPNPGLNAALDDLSDVVISGAALDQVIKYNGTSWVNAASPGGGGGTVTSIAAGTGLSASPSSPITTSGTLSLANTSVTAASYGSATEVPTYTVNAQGQLTAASNTTIAITQSQVTGLTSALANFSYKSQYYYDTKNATVASGTAVLANNNDLMFYPYEVTTAFTIDRISINVTSAAGQATTVVRLGIYADNGSGSPGSLVLDAGTVQVNSTGTKTITVSQSLAKGIYWFAAWSSRPSGGNASINSYSTGGTTSDTSVGQIADTYSNTASPLGYLINTTYGTFPSTFPTGTWTDSTTAVRIKIRAS